jgi:hypothetical protein
MNFFLGRGWAKQGESGAFEKVERDEREFDWLLGKRDSSRGQAC